jgi:tryptophanyl-tRNA synthetase
MLAQHVAENLKPVHERMDYYTNHLDEIYSIIDEGNQKAKEIACQTMNEVRNAVKI